MKCLVYIFEVVDRKARIARLRRIARYGRSQARLSKELKRQADRQDKRWWRNAALGGTAWIVGTKHPGEPNPYDKSVYDKRRAAAASLMGTYDRDASKAYLRANRARRLVVAYGHPKKPNRLRARASLAAGKFLGSPSKDPRHQIWKDVAMRRKERVRAHPSSGEERQRRLKRIAARATDLLARAVQSKDPEERKRLMRNHNRYTRVSMLRDPNPDRQTAYWARKKMRVDTR